MLRIGALGTLAAKRKRRNLVKAGARASGMTKAGSHASGMTKAGARTPGLGRWGGVLFLTKLSIPICIWLGVLLSPEAISPARAQSADLSRSQAGDSAQAVDPWVHLALPPSSASASEQAIDPWAHLASPPSSVLAPGAASSASPFGPLVEYRSAMSPQDARKQISADPICLACPCKVEERSTLTPVALDLLLDQSTSALGIKRAGKRVGPASAAPEERNQVVSELARYVDEAARAQRVTLGDAGKRFIRTKNVLSLRGNYSPIARGVKEASERAEALVVMTDGLEDEGPGTDQDRACTRECANARDALGCRCSCRRNALVGQVRSTLSSGRHMFWLTFPPANRSDECSIQFAEATRQIGAACNEHRRPTPGAPVCRHVVLAGADLRRGKLAGVEERVGKPLKEFFDVVRKQTQNFGVTRVLPRPPSPLRLGDGRSWRCSAAPVAPDVLIAPARCLPVTRALDEDEASGRTRVLDVVDVALAPASVPGAGVALVRLKNEGAPLFVPPRRRARDAEPPSGVLRLFGHGDRGRMGNVGNVGSTGNVSASGGVAAFVDLSAAGWGCDGRRVGQTGCAPGLDLVLLGSPGRDACLGESGGPVYELIGEGEGGGWCGFRLVAAASRTAGDPRAACGTGAIATRVDALDSWIERTLTAWKGPRSP